MAKIGENVPLLIDKAVDFMASSQAFREYLNKRRRVIMFLPRCRRRARPFICSVWNITGGCTDQKKKKEVNGGIYF